MTAAIAYIEGTTPETAVYQAPEGPAVPGANLFQLEFIDDRIGPRLFAAGIPAGRPIIIDGVEVNVSAGPPGRIVAIGDGTRDLSASAVQNNRASVAQKQIPVSGLMNGDITVRGVPGFGDWRAFVIATENLPPAWQAAIRRATRRADLKRLIFCTAQNFER